MGYFNVYFVVEYVNVENFFFNYDKIKENIFEKYFLRLSRNVVYLCLNIVIGIVILIESNGIEVLLMIVV